MSYFRVDFRKIKYGGICSSENTFVFQSDTIETAKRIIKEAYPCIPFIDELGKDNFNPFCVEVIEVK